MPQIIFTDKTGSHPCSFTPGETVLTVARRNKIDLEGACDGAMACSTCHVIIAKDWLAKIPAPRSEENAMLDLATNVTRHSRLGCQIVLTAELDGLSLRVA